MTQIISSEGLGLLGSTLNLDSNSQSRVGQNPSTSHVNVATGNLVLTRHDEVIAAQGQHRSLVSTYNSRAELNGRTAFQFNFEQRLVLGSGTPNSTHHQISRISADGTQTTFTYDSSDGLYHTTDGSGAHDTLEYRSNDALPWVYTEGSSRYQEHYDANGLLVQISDLDHDGITTLTYVDGKVSTITDASNQVTTLVYSNGRVSAVNTATQDGQGNTIEATQVKYEYDAHNRLHKVHIDLTPENQSDNQVYSTTYTYDGNSERIASITQSDGSTVAYRYDSLQRLERQIVGTGSDQRVTRYVYGTQQTEIIHVINSNTDSGPRTLVQYDSQHRITEITTPADINGLTSTTSYTYDSDDNVIAVTDAAGSTISRRYDADGNMIEEQNELGETVTFQYDDQNRLIEQTHYKDRDSDGINGSATPNNGSSQHFIYDQNGLRFTVSHTGQVNESRYNELGQMTQSWGYTAHYTGTHMTLADLLSWSHDHRDALTQRSEHRYDFRGQLRQTTHFTELNDDGSPIRESGLTQHFTYDLHGQLLKSIDAKGNETTYTYDGMGRLLTTVNAKAQTASNVTYDDANQRVITAHLGDLHTVTVTNSAGVVTSRQQVETSTQSSDGTTHYLYDTLGRQVVVTDPSGISQYTLYDDLNRVLATVNGHGEVTEFRYDAAGRVVETVQYANQKALPTDFKTTISTITDLASLFYATVQPSQHADDRYTATYYDDAGRIAGTQDGHGALVEYRYDGAGNLVETIAYSNIAEIRSDYDANRTFDQAAFDTLVHSIVKESAHDRHTYSIYDASGKMLASVDGEGYLTEYQYSGTGQQTTVIQYSDKAKAVADLSNKLLTQSGHALVAQLKPSQTTDQAALNRPTFYAYNDLGQLTAELNPEGALTEYRYDANGHMTQQTTYATLIPQTVGPFDLENDRPNATAADQTTRYYYNELNQLVTEITPLGQVTEYHYTDAGQVSNQITYATALDHYGALGATQSVENISNEGRITKQDSVNLIDGGSAAVWLEEGTFTLALYSDGTPSTPYSTLNHEAIDGAENLSIGQLSDGHLVIVWNQSNGHIRAQRIDLENNVIGTEFQISTSTAHAVEAITVEGLDNGNMVVAWQARQSHDSDQIIYSRTVSNTGAALSDVQTVSSHTANGDSAPRIFELEGGDYHIQWSANTKTELRQVIYGDLFAVWQEHINDNTLMQRSYNSSGAALTDEIQIHPALPEQISGLNYQTLSNGDLVITWVSSEQLYGQRYSQESRQWSAVTAIAQAESASGFDQVEQRWHNDQLVLSLVDGASTERVILDFKHYAEEWIPQSRHNDRESISSYNYKGALTQTTSPLGESIDYQYDAAGRLKKTTNHTLSTHEYHYYDGVGRLKYVVNGAGEVTETQYNHFGEVEKVLQYENRISDTSSFTGGLLGSTDPVSNALGSNASFITVIENRYDHQGRLISTADGNSVETRQEYNAFGELSQIAKGVEAALSSAESFTAYRYDRRGLLTQSIKDATVTETVNSVTTTLHQGDDLTTTTHYDAFGRLSKVTNHNHALLTEKIYDRWESRVDTKTYFSENKSGTESIEHDAFGRIKARYQFDTTVTRPGTPDVEFSYNDKDQTITRRDINQNSSVTKVNGLGDTVEHKNALGIITQYETDAAGNITRMIEAVGRDEERVTQYVYNAAGQLRFEVDALRYVTQHHYDDAGRLIERTRFATQTSLSSLDALSYEMVDAAVTTDAEQDQTDHYIYNSRGLVIYHIDAMNYVTKSDYDHVGNLERSTRFSHTYAGPATQSDIERPATSGGLTANSAQDQLTTYQYDDLGRLTAETLKLFEHGAYTDLTESYQYDARGNLTAKTDRRGNITTYAYNDLNQLTGELRPKHSVDGDTAAADRKGYLTHYEYDLQGNRTKETLYMAEMSIYNRRADSYIDNSGNIIANLVTTTGGESGDRVTEYEFDTLGRTHRVISPEVNGKHSIVENQYDSIGNLVDIVEIEASGSSANNSYIETVLRVTHFEFDELGRVTHKYEGLKEIPTGFAENLTALENPSYSDYLDSIEQDPVTHTLTLSIQTPESFSEEPLLRITADGEVIFDQLPLTRKGSNLIELDLDDRIPSSLTIQRIDTTGTDLTIGYIELAGIRFEQNESLTIGESISMDTTHASEKEIEALFHSLRVSKFEYDAFGNIITELTPNAHELVTSNKQWAQNERARIAEKARKGDYNPLYTLNSLMDRALRSLPTDKNDLTAVQYDAIIQLYSKNNTYDGLNRLTRSSYFDGESKQATSYDAFNNVISTEDALGNKTVLFYDALNRLRFTKDGAGYVTERAYSHSNLVEKETNYHQAIQSITESHSLSEIATLLEQASSNLVNTEHYQVNTETRYVYDNVNQLKQIQKEHIQRDGLEQTIYETYAYDRNGNQINQYMSDTAAHNEAARSYEYRYDAQNKLISELKPESYVSVRNSSDSYVSVRTRLETTQAYDAAGNLISTTEGSNFSSTDLQYKTVFTYNKKNQITKRIQTSHIETYNPTTDATTDAYSETVYEYDSLGRNTASEDRIIASHDTNNIMQSRRTQEGYDLFDQKIWQVAPNGSLNVTAYDPSGNSFILRQYGHSDLSNTDWESIKSQLTSGSDDYRQTTQLFTLSGNLTESSQRTEHHFDLDAVLDLGSTYGDFYGYFEGSPKTVREYDKAGNLIKVRDANHNNTYYFYNERGEQIGKVDAEGFVTEFEYSHSGQLTRETKYAIALRDDEQPWNENSDFTTLINWVKSDDNALSTSVTQSPYVINNSDNRTTILTYDSLDRLIEKVTSANTSTTDAALSTSSSLNISNSQLKTIYQYDERGNMTKEINAEGDETDFNYNNLNQTISQIAPSMIDYRGNSVRLKTIFSYDQNGEVVRTDSRGVLASTEEDLNYDQSLTQSTTLLRNSSGFVEQEKKFSASNEFSTTYFNHNGFGNVTRKQWSITNHDDSTQHFKTTFHYDELGRETSRTDHNIYQGDTSERARGALISDTLTYMTSYNDYGDITSKGTYAGTQPTGFQAQEQFFYNKHGSVFKTNAGNGTWRVYLYDRAGNATNEISAVESFDLRTPEGTVTSTLGSISSTGQIHSVPLQDVQMKLSRFNGNGQIVDVYEPPMVFDNLVGDITLTHASSTDGTTESTTESALEWGDIKLSQVGQWTNIAGKTTSTLFTQRLNRDVYDFSDSNAIGIANTLGLNTAAPNKTLLTPSAAPKEDVISDITTNLFSASLDILEDHATFTVSQSSHLNWTIEFYSHDLDRIEQEITNNTRGLSSGIHLTLTSSQYDIHVSAQERSSGETVVNYTKKDVLNPIGIDSLEITWDIEKKITTTEVVDINGSILERYTKQDTDHTIHEEALKKSYTTTVDANGNSTTSVDERTDSAKKAHRQSQLVGQAHNNVRERFFGNYLKHELDIDKANTVSLKELADNNNYGTISYLPSDKLIIGHRRGTHDGKTTHRIKTMNSLAATPGSNQELFLKMRSTQTTSYNSHLRKNVNNVTITKSGRRIKNPYIIQDETYEREPISFNSSNGLEAESYLYSGSIYAMDSKLNSDHEVTDVRISITTAGGHTRASGDVNLYRHYKNNKYFTTTINIPDLLTVGQIPDANKVVLYHYRNGSLLKSVNLEYIEKDRNFIWEDTNNINWGSDTFKLKAFYKPEEGGSQKDELIMYADGRFDSNYTPTLTHNTIHYVEKNTTGEKERVYLSGVYEDTLDDHWYTDPAQRSYIKNIAYSILNTGDSPTSSSNDLSDDSTTPIYETDDNGDFQGNIIHRSQKYNAFGDIISETDGRGYTTFNRYNNVGWLEETRAPETDVYKESGSAIRLSPTKRYFYNALGELVASEDANSTSSSGSSLYEIRVRDNGKVTKEIHRDSGVKLYGYDVYGNTRRVIDEIDQHTRNEFDINGNITSTTKFQVKSDATTSDRRNLNVSLGKLDTLATEEYGYDELGKRISHTNAIGLSEHYIYDGMGRIRLHAELSDLGILGPQNTSGPITRYDYEFKNELTHQGSGFLKTTANELAGLAWNYHNNVANEAPFNTDEYEDSVHIIEASLTNTNPNGHHKIIDAENYFGKKQYHIDMGGHRFDYEYNDAGWLVKQTANTGVRDAASGDYVTETLGAGANKYFRVDQHITYDYYANGHLKSVNDTGTNTQSRFAYDKNGNRIQEIIHHNSEDLDIEEGSQENYELVPYQVSHATYDELNRIKYINDAEYSVFYGYDANSNRRFVGSYFHDGSATPSDEEVETLQYYSDRVSQWGSQEVKVNMKTSLYDGVGANYEILADGVTIGSGTLTNTTYQEFTFHYEGSPAKEIQVRFTNDAADDNQDRNLFVEWLEYQMVRYQSDSSAVIYNRANDSIKGQSSMDRNGSLHFNTSMKAGSLYGYIYDSMDRFTTTMGKVTLDASGNIHSINIGHTGFELSYNKSGQRTQQKSNLKLLNGTPQQEVERYYYNGLGQLARIEIGTSESSLETKGLKLHDASGRLVQEAHVTSSGDIIAKHYNYTAYNQLNDSTTYEPTSTSSLSGAINLNSFNLVYRDDTDLLISHTTRNGLSKSQTDQYSYLVDQKTLDIINQKRYVDGSVDTEIDLYYLYYQYDRFDEFKLSQVIIKGTGVDDHREHGWKSGYSLYQYNGNGHVRQVRDGHANRTLSYVNNHRGMVLQRQEDRMVSTTESGKPFHRDFYYMNGIVIGDVGNDDTIASRVDYAQSLALIDADNHNDIGDRVFPTISADFDQNFRPINANYPAKTGTQYRTVEGDTLQGIAAALWGDSSLWYLIADANALSADTALEPNLSLHIPNVVTNIHNNSDTFRPYDAGLALGDTNPTLPEPPPPPSPECGVKQILIVVVAAVAAAFTAGAAFAAMGFTSAAAGGGALTLGAAITGTAAAGASTLAVAGGIIAASAIGGAVGSITRQGLNIATGEQDHFSWSQVGKEALVGGVSGGLTMGANVGLQAISNSGNWASSAATMIHNSRSSQYMMHAASSEVGRIAANQSTQFEWRNVAVAGLLPTASKGLDKVIGVDILDAANSARNPLTRGAAVLSSEAIRENIRKNIYGEKFDYHRAGQNAAQSFIQPVVNEAAIEFAEAAGAALGRRHQPFSDNPTLQTSWMYGDNYLLGKGASYDVVTPEEMAYARAINGGNLPSEWFDSSKKSTAEQIHSARDYYREHVVPSLDRDNPLAAVEWLAGRYGKGEAGHGQLSPEVMNYLLGETHQWTLGREFNALNSGLASGAPGLTERSVIQTKLLANAGFAALVHDSGIDVSSMSQSLFGWAPDFNTWRPKDLVLDDGVVRPMDSTDRTYNGIHPSEYGESYIDIQQASGDAAYANTNEQRQDNINVLLNTIDYAATGIGLATGAGAIAILGKYAFKKVAFGTSRKELFKSTDNTLRTLERIGDASIITGITVAGAKYHIDPEKNAGGFEGAILNGLANKTLGSTVQFGKSDINAVIGVNAMTWLKNAFFDIPKFFGEDVSGIPSEGIFLPRLNNDQ